MVARYRRDRETAVSRETFGAPAFVNYGKDNARARDAYVCAISGEGRDNGSHCRLARVAQATICQRDAWEWVSGFAQDSSPTWSAMLYSTRVRA